MYMSGLLKIPLTPSLRVPFVEALSVVPALALQPLTVTSTLRPFRLQLSASASHFIKE